MPFLVADPFFDCSLNMFIKINAASSAFFDIAFRFTENNRKNQINQKTRQKQFHHGFRKNKMTAMIINKNFQVTAAFGFLDLFIHPGDAPAGVPHNIVLCPGEDQIPIDSFNRDPFGFSHRMLYFSEIMKIQRGNHISALFSFFLEHLPIIRMFIRGRHIR